MYLATIPQFSVQVVDNVLKDPEASDVVLYNRAKVTSLYDVTVHSHWLQGLLITGAIFKSTIPDESDEERRELERYVPRRAVIFPWTDGVVGWLPKQPRRSRNRRRHEPRKRGGSRCSDRNRRKRRQGEPRAQTPPPHPLQLSESFAAVHIS